ncbi:MAG: 50S ribosomal protein L29 [Crocinitomicaceae bacterium]
MTQQEIIKLSDEDLKNRLTDFQSQMETLKLTHKMAPIENPMRIRGMRKLIARLNTEVTNRKVKA